ncbi:hypothetical protein SKC37_07775 [Aquirufa sp. HETE-83D]|uniref:Uncharacterized protein n=1 Tax=Aquirufa esocilacus TaxID=3096513 RepID=A0ABW6DS85_9BACT
MKKIVFLFLISISVFAQTGIGTTTPHASAKLDVSSTNKGFLPPRVTLTGISDNSTIASPATGLLVYNTGDNVGLPAGYYFWNGNAWATIATAGGSGSFAASFLRGSRTASQSSIAVGGIVSFSAVDNTSGQDISLNTTNGKITLAPGNTYRLMAAVPNFSGNRPAFMWYNETSSSYIGSATNGYSPTDGAANAGAFGGLAEVIITPNVSTVLSFRLLSSQSSGAVTVGGLVDFSTTGSYPWFEAQVISGNAPVTGQSVDYIQASLSANQTLSAVGNINFNTSSGAGITLTSGGFELKANKTYKLEAAMGGSSSGYAYYTWVDNLNSKLPGASIGVTMQAGDAHTDAPQDKAVVFYTPTVNTTVFLRVLNVSGSVTAYAPPVANNYSSTWATIQQVGSSAIVNPWVLNGNDVYNTTGKIGIGTNSPDASAILDLSSTTKGVLIPRMTAAQKAAISGPTTGLLIYQTDAPSDFYYYNGSSWISLREPNWTSAGTIQSVGWNATTTAPTIGTTSVNDYSYKQMGSKTWKCQLTYSAGGSSTGANNGSGDYLFTLPNGLQFNTSIAGQAAISDNVGTSTWVWPGVWLSSSTGSITNLSQGGLLYVVPYSSTQFRLIHVGIAGIGYLIPYSSGYYGVGSNNSWRVTFTFQSL